MAPPRGSVSSSTSNSLNFTTAYSLSLLSEYTHTLDSLPLDLSRNFADLRELDAVLSSSMASITAKIRDLTVMIEQGNAPKAERLWLLKEISDEATRLKLGGEDKIRVACQAADNLKSHTSHLRLLAESVPGFDPATLNRKTTYPHIAAKSFMPSASAESGRRRRGGFGSLLVSAPDQSPVKRKRVARDEDLDMSHTKSPKKDSRTEANPRSRNGVRPKKNERGVSPTESILSVTSHIQTLPLQNSTATSHGTMSNAGSRLGNGSASLSSNKRARPPGNNTRGPTPQPNEPYPSPHDHSIGNHTLNNSNHHGNSNNDSNNTSNSHSRREYNVPPSSSIHPSLPHPYQPTEGSTHRPGNTNASPHVTYDIQVLPHSLSNTPDWNPPLSQQLEGPGMPVARSQSIHPVLPNAPIGAVGGGLVDGGETGEGDGDGDDRTYCFCDGVSYGEMIACDDEQCEREWFHLTCIGLAVPPDGLWFCDTCKSKRNSKRSARGGKRRAAGNRTGGRTT